MPVANSKKRKMASSTGKFYAVRAGYKPGVYSTWPECQEQISGFKGAQFKSFTTYEDATAFAAGKDVPSTSDEAPRFYAVAIGSKPGVYTSWPKAQEAILGVKGPKYKRFSTKAEAEAFVRTFSEANENSADTPVDISDEDDILEVAPPPAKKAKVSTATGVEKVPVVYTDGSSLGNGKLGAAAGVGVYFGPDDPRNVSERLKGEPQTNQRAELMAILRCLQIIGDSKPVEIRSDSKYSIQCVTEWYKNWERNGWKTAKGDVMNKDIIKPVRDRLEAREKKGVRTQFVWVRGHANEPGNEAADALANAGARMK